MQFAEGVVVARPRVWNYRNQVLARVILGALAAGAVGCGSATLHTDGGGGNGGAAGQAGAGGGAGAAGMPGGLGGAAGAGGAGGSAGSGAAAIAITTPASPTYTNKAVTVGVTVTASGASSVQLLKNGAVLSALTGPPYSYSWDTTKETEGSYQLVAQMVVGGQIVASAPLTVVVDRTPPTIVTKSPDSGATNVSLTDPIQAVFSEALAPTTVTASAVTLALGSTAVGTTAALGADGKTVTLSITNLASLVLPGTMTENATTAITDLAGNAFAGASWNFVVPLWVDLGTVNGAPVNGAAPQLVLDPTGQPIVTTLVSGTSAVTVQVAKHVSGTTWDSTSIPSPQTHPTAVQFGLAIGKTGNLFLAWTENVSGSLSPVYIARWTGTSWDTSFGHVLNSTTVAAENPTIAVNSQGQPVVRWGEQTGLDAGPGYVATWTGTAWSQYSGAFSGACDIQPCHLVLDSSDFPITHAVDNVIRWTGTSWTTPAMASDGLAINSSQQAITFTNSGTTLQVLSISAAGAATNYVPALSVAPLEKEPVGLGQVAVDTSDEPVLLWFQYDGGTPANPTNPNLHVARWTGAAWDQAYGTLNNANGHAALALLQGTTPIVAWEDASGATVHVSKSNH